MPFWITSQIMNLPFRDKNSVLRLCIVSCPFFQSSPDISPFYVYFICECIAGAPWFSPCPCSLCKNKNLFIFSLQEKNTLKTETSGSAGVKQILQKIDSHHPSEVIFCLKTDFENGMCRIFIRSDTQVFIYFKSELQWSKLSSKSTSQRIGKANVVPVFTTAMKSVGCLPRWLLYVLSKQLFSCLKLD